MKNSQIKIEKIHSKEKINWRFYWKDKWKCLITLFCLFNLLTMGIQMELTGSTMSSLMKQVERDLSDLTWIVASRSFGFIFSIILFGILFQSLTKNHSEWILSIGFLLPTIASILIPHLKSLYLLCFCLFLQGFFQGFSELAINRLITVLWCEHSTSPLNLIYFGYPCGALLSILFVQLFRSTNWNLMGPYSLASIFSLICSIGFFLIGLKEKKRKKRLNSSNQLETILKKIHERENSIWIRLSPTTCGNRYFLYGFSLLINLILFQISFGGIEQGLTKFFVSFLEKEKILNVKDSTNAMIFYWFPMLIGRIFSTYLTVNYLRPGSMLFICLIFQLFIYFCWIYFLWKNQLNIFLIYLLVTGNGLSISSISPTFIGWAKLFLDLTPFELTLILLSNASGGIIISPSVRLVFKYFPSKHLFTLLIFCASFCLIFYSCGYFIEYFHRKKRTSFRSHRQSKQIDQTDETFLPSTS